MNFLINFSANAQKMAADICRISAEFLEMRTLRKCGTYGMLRSSCLNSIFDYCCDLDELVMKTERKRKYKKVSAIIGRIRDLGQLLARAQFWLVGFRGSQKARQVPFHNRFVEVFFRCWHANKRGLVLTASEQSRADRKGNVEFFRKCKCCRAHTTHLRFFDP